MSAIPTDWRSHYAGVSARLRGAPAPAHVRVPTRDDLNATVARLEAEIAAERRGAADQLERLVESQEQVADLRRQVKRHRDNARRWELEVAASRETVKGLQHTVNRQRETEAKLMEAIRSHDADRARMRDTLAILRVKNGDLYASLTADPRRTPHRAEQEDMGVQILREEAEASGFAVADLLSPRRSGDLVDIRRHIAIRMRTETTLSYPQIGKIMQRDHTSIMALLGRKKRAS